MFYDRRDRIDPYQWKKRFVLLAVLEDGSGEWYERLAFCCTVWRRLSSNTLVVGNKVFNRYEYRSSLPSMSHA